VSEGVREWRGGGVRAGNLCPTHSCGGCWSICQRTAVVSIGRVGASRGRSTATP
jgi:hypothetical protein